MPFFYHPSHQFTPIFFDVRPVAETADPEKVALETGNSAEVIMEDYLELATPEEAARWFKISPSAQQLKALTAYANKLKQSSGV